MNKHIGHTNNFVKPTTGFWQEIMSTNDPQAHTEPPYHYSYPAMLRDGRRLLLPLRILPDGKRASASLIANHASFTVIDELTKEMTKLVREKGAEQVVGMPTLGLAFAPGIAHQLGLANYVPLGYSRKFWYQDALSEPVHSITTPGAGKSIYIDPNIVPRLRGRRIAIVDDAVSSGSTMVSVLRLLRRLECEVCVIAVAMVQGVRWKEALSEIDPAEPDLVQGVFSVPFFERVENGWVPEPGTLHVR